MDYADIILYCGIKDPPAVTGPGGNIITGRQLLDLLDEVVADYVIVAQSGGKVVAHCRVEKTAQAKRIKQWIDAHPEGGIKYWPSYKALWQDGATGVRAIAKRVLLHPVVTQLDGHPVTTMRTVLEAEQAGVTIVPANIQVPHQWAGSDSESG